MSSSQAIGSPTLQSYFKHSLFAPKTGSPYSLQLIKTQQSSNICKKPPVIKTERARTFNFSQSESKPESKRWDAVGKIEKSINILRKTKGQVDFSFQIKVEEIINEMMVICGIDEKVSKLFLQIKEEREQRKQSQLKTLKFIKGQLDQIEQLVRISIILEKKMLGVLLITIKYILLSYNYNQLFQYKLILLSQNYHFKSQSSRYILHGINYFWIFMTIKQKKDLCQIFYLQLLEFIQF